MDFKRKTFGILVGKFRPENPEKIARVQRNDVGEFFCRSCKKKCFSGYQERITNFWPKNHGRFLESPFFGSAVTL